MWPFFGGFIFGRAQHLEATFVTSRNIRFHIYRDRRPMELAESSSLQILMFLIQGGCRDYSNITDVSRDDIDMAFNL